MTILRDLSILWSLFHILILFMMLYRSRYPRKKTFIITGVTMGPLILLNVAGLAVYGAGVMGKLFILTCTLPSLLFFWIMSKDRKGRFFFTFCTADTVSLWVITVTNILDFYFGGEQYILMFVGRLVLFPLIEWAAYRFLRKPYLELQEAVPGGWGVFAGMTAVYYILLAVMGNFPVIITARAQELPAFILVLVLMPMTYATIFLALYRQLIVSRKQQSERSLQAQKSALEQQLDNQQRILKMKHDMRAHINTLAGLLATGKTEKMKEYLESVETEMEALPETYCENPYINAELVQYEQKFKDMGAEYRIDIQSETGSLPYMDLCQILSNGLENACDALREMEPQERVLKTLHKNGTLVFTQKLHYCLFI